MLTEIHIHHLVTIQELHLDVQSGTTVITGETGAGKSMLIDAIELALGARANSDRVRPGQEKAEISLSFYVAQLEEAKEWLKHFDLLNDHHECIIRRVIYQDGRSKSYINGMPTTLQPLRELGERLIQMHGQHEHQSLLKTDYQRNLLDRYAGHQHLVDKTHMLADQWHQMNHELLEFQKRMEERRARLDMLSFQQEELDKLQLTDDEFKQLDLEHKQLAHAGELLQHLHQAINSLVDNEDHNALTLLQHSLQAVEKVQKVDPKIATWVDTLNNIIIHVTDLEDELRRYLDHVDIDPARLTWVENRLSTLFDAARKYKINPNELPELQQRILKELKELQQGDTTLTELSEQRELIKQHYEKTAKELSASRASAAKTLTKDINTIIHQLSLPHANFQINLENETTLTPLTHGLEKIIFEIQTNAGQSLQPLAKIASGGELSRIGLAIHMATAGKHGTPTLLFDEVDVGIGGGTAEKVGKLLRKLGETHQLLCITHQPQVAALGHHHWQVTKAQSKNSTKTDIQALSHQEKIAELARMLGGVEITSTTLAHAQELVDKIEA